MSLRCPGRKPSTFYLPWQTVLVTTSVRLLPSQTGAHRPADTVNTRDKKGRLLWSRRANPWVREVPLLVSHSIQERAYPSALQGHSFSLITASTVPCHCQSVTFPLSVPSHPDLSGHPLPTSVHKPRLHLSLQETSLQSRNQTRPLTLVAPWWLHKHKLLNRHWTGPDRFFQVYLPPNIHPVSLTPAFSACRKSDYTSTNFMPGPWGSSTFSFIPFNNGFVSFTFCHLWRQENNSDYLGLSDMFSPGLIEGYTTGQMRCWNNH